MSTGRAKALLACAALVALGGCASSEPQTILSAAELEAMIRVEIRPLEPAMPGETAVASVQP
jgi:hypothetical protein